MSDFFCLCFEHQNQPNTKASHHFKKKKKNSVFIILCEPFDLLFLPGLTRRPVGLQRGTESRSSTSVSHQQLVSHGLTLLLLYSNNRFFFPCFFWFLVFVFSFFFFLFWLCGKMKLSLRLQRLYQKFECLTCLIYIWIIGHGSGFQNFSQRQRGINSFLLETRQTICKNLMGLSLIWLRNSKLCINKQISKYYGSFSV